MTRKTIFLSVVLLLCHGLAFAQEQWEQLVEGFYEGQRANLFHPGVRRGKAAPIDLDGDGDLDLLVGGEQFVRYYRNDGTQLHPSWTLVDGNFFDMPQGTAYHMLVPVAADLDADGDTDLIISSHNGWVYWYRNDGDLSFTEVTNNLVENVGGPACVDAKDMDNDGDYDIVLGVEAGGEYFVENVGSRTNPAFDSPVSLGLENNGENTRYFSLCDIDGDGDYDLFSSTEGYGNDKDQPPYRFEFYRNVGTPESFSFALETNSYFEEVSDTFCLHSTFFDADSDGDSDCLLFTIRPGGAGGEAGGFYGFMRNVGTLQAADWKLTRDHFQTITYKQLNGIAAFGDLDDDGDLDMVQLGANIAFGLYENRGSPTCPNWHLADANYIPHPAPIYMIGSPDSFHSPVLWDIDSDGDLDFFAINVSGKKPTGPRINFWRNNGTKAAPPFALESTGWQGINPDWMGHWYRSLCFGDLNGDGKADLLMGTSSPGTIIWYVNEGTASSPSFDANSPLVLVTAAFPPGVSTTIATPHLCDVDRDGDLDLFVSVWGDSGPGSGDGQVNFFRNAGTPSSHNFVLETPKWMGLDFYMVPVASGADIDGDGAPNLFLSDINGGMLQYRCVQPSLSVYPVSATVLAGASLDFVTSGALGAVTAAIVENRSGGTTTGLTYTAGPLAGVVDRIKFTDSGSPKVAYAYVNVISPSDVTASGKAVIMAGRMLNDPLWPTTNNLAHFVYRTLLYRGFSKENVYYLNPDTAQDADGNGAQDDIDAASTLANVEYALTTFAAGSPNLFVYLIDHGGEYAANAYVRCNETQILYASLVDQWLDALQNSGTTTLTLVVDCCQSGGFLDKCHATGAQQRVAIGSADYLEPAFFSAGGLISFTNAFVGGLYSGLTVGEAFNLAAGAVDRYQRPQLDDDGDGAYDKDADGELAKRLTVGASFIAGADRPQIGKISANQTLTGGDASAAIWASDVSSVYPIDRVWATIAAPGFLPDSALDPANPVTNLPQLDLIWSATNSRYEATTNTFTEMGAYAVSIYARDIWGGVSYPKQTYVNQMESDEQMVIVCGDGAYDSNSPWANSNNLARFVYETARARWMAHDKISYLTSAASSPDRPVDGAPSEAALAATISAASGAGKLTVYLVGSGDASAFDIDGDGAASDPGDLTPAELDTYLDALQSGGSTRVIVVLDFNRSGGWISTLMASTGQERIIIASSRNSEDSWCEAGGALSFTQWFFSWVFNGVNIRDAFSWARWAVRGVTGETQNPQLDDDGSGAANRLDGALALTTYIGAAFVTGAELPVIGDYAADVVLTSSTATLWASGVWDADGIAEVYAYVIPPGATATSGGATRVDLAYNASSGRWEGLHSSFDPSKVHTVVYFAKDRSGDLSDPYTTTFAPAGSDDVYDRFYDDDTSASLNFLPPGEWSQQHNFWLEDDEDWIAFHANASEWYSVLVTNQSSSCDAAIAMYAKSDMGTPLAERDDYGPGGPDELISWWSGATSGTILVRVTQSPLSPGLSGGETSYTLVIHSDSGANNGLAFPVGTGQLRLMWDENNKPAGAQGYHVRRSSSGRPASYAQVNSSLLSAASYDDSGLEPDTVYFYQIYMVETGHEPYPWTPPFAGLTSATIPPTPTPTPEPPTSTPTPTETPTPTPTPVYYEPDPHGKWNRAPNPQPGSLVAPPTQSDPPGKVGFTVVNTDDPAGKIMFASWNIGTDAGGTTLFPMPGNATDMTGKLYEAQLRLRSDSATADKCPGYRAEFTNMGYTHFGGVEVSTSDAANAPYDGHDFWVTLLWEVPFGCSDMSDSGMLAAWPYSPLDYRDYTLLFDLFHNQTGDYGVMTLEEIVVQAIDKPATPASSFTYSNYSSWIGAFLHANDPSFKDGTTTPTATNVTIQTGSFDTSGLTGARFAGAFPPVSVIPGDLAGNVACLNNRTFNYSCTAASVNIETTPIVRLYLQPMMSRMVGSQMTRNIIFFTMFGAVDPFAKLKAEWGGRITSPSLQPNPGVPPAGAGTTLTHWCYTHGGYNETEDYFVPNIQVLSLNVYPPMGAGAGSGWQDDSGGITFSNVTVRYYN